MGTVGASGGRLECIVNTKDRERVVEVGGS